MEIAIISGKGGTGKSSVSAAFATLGKELVLADCDVDAANLFLLFNPEIEKEEVFVSGQAAYIDKDICTNCGVCIDYCRFDAIHKIDGEVLISETECEGCELCVRVCPEEAIYMEEEDRSRLYSGNFRNGKMVYGRLAPGEENSGKLVDQVRKRAKALAENSNLNTIIIDGPPGIGCAVLSSVTGVDHVVIVTEPTKSGLHDLKRSVEMVRSFEVSMQVIINKFDLNKAMADEIEAYCLDENVPVSARIPFDSRMVDAMVNCQSIVEYAPDSLAAQELSKVFASFY